MAEFLPGVSLAHGQSSLNVFDKSGFRDVTEELDAVIDNSFGYAANHISLGEIRKLTDFDYIGHDA